MKNKKETIRKIVTYLNNPDEQGGMWLPNIQRKFVWKPEQMEALFDSIMREYPISTLLIWKTKEKIKTRKFIENYNQNIKITDFYIPENNNQKLLVLDGQQRLQTLFIALNGSYEGKELYVDILSGKEPSQDDIKYHFKFLDKDKVKYNWIKFKEIVFSRKQYYELGEEIISKMEEDCEKELIDDDKKIVRDTVAMIVKLFVGDDSISYQEVDSIDNPELYSINDVVEVFIRANSGGTKLGKSDLLFSLLSSNWDLAEQEIQELQEELNKGGYKFDRDFILKTCLCLIEKGAKYDVKKFREKDNLKNIEDNWEKISEAIKDVKDFIYGKTFIKSDNALPSYLCIIPLIYFRYNFKDKWVAGIKDLDKWILKVLLKGSFSGSPDGLIDQINKKIKVDENFNIDNINQIILNAGRNLQITDETILNNYYGGKYLYLIFNIWYGKFDFTPSYDGNLPQVDHIFPQSVLTDIKVVNPVSGRNVMKYKKNDRDIIANLMVLTQQENGAGGKGDTSPEEWFKDKGDPYLEMHLIPKDKELWKIENFEKFIEARKELLIKKLKEYIN